MAGKCDEAVYLALAAIVAEFTLRLHESDGTLAHGFLKDASFADFKNHVYVLFFVFSVCSTVFYVRGLQSPRLPLWLAPYIPYLYMFDSVAAVGLGISLHYEHRVGTVVSMVVLTNFFMLHILHSIFSAKKAHHLHDELLATIKAYIHHAANFFFIDLAHKEVLAVATVWRAISMTGHTAQALKVPPLRCPRHDPRFINHPHAQVTGAITEQQLYRFNWALTHVRNVVVAGILLLCLASRHVREGFGLSAVGHVGYILVRAGPVFRLGSVYVGDRPRWQGLTDRQRLGELLQGRHPFLAAEVGSLLFLAALFLGWRFTSDPTRLLLW